MVEESDVEDWPPPMFESSDDETVPAVDSDDDTDSETDGVSLDANHSESSELGLPVPNGEPVILGIDLVETQSAVCANVDVTSSSPTTIGASVSATSSFASSTQPVSII